jgi:hypothetical protein
MKKSHKGETLKLFIFFMINLMTLLVNKLQHRNFYIYKGNGRGLNDVIILSFVWMD